MATTSSQLKVTHYPGFGGNFIDSDYLAAAYDTGKPHVFQNLFRKVYTAMNRFSDKPLQAMTAAAGNKITIDDEIYRWYMQGAEEKAIRIVENLEEGNLTPGIGGTPIRFKFDEGWVAAPEVILGENNEYPIRLISGPVSDGNGEIYEGILETDDTSVFLPPSLLEVGREFCKAWTSVASEMNDEFGGQYYSGSYQLESQVGAFAQEFSITDKALRQEGRIGIPLMDANGKKVERFLPMAEMKMYDEIEMSIEVQLWLGKKSTKRAANGYWRKTGPGLREQLKDGHVEYYSGALTEARLKDYLLDIFFGRNDESNRKVTFLTGTMGSIQFHDLLADASRGFLTVDTNYIERMKSSKTLSRHLSYGAQFKHYQGPEGIEVDLIKVPLYDDRRYCKRMHPIETNRPIDSYRMTVVDFSAPSSTSFGSNINFLEVKDTYREGYVPGTVGPAGPIKGGMTVKKVAAYERFVERTAGIQVVDTSRTGELILDFEE